MANGTYTAEIETDFSGAFAITESAADDFYDAVNHGDPAKIAQAHQNVLSVHDSLVDGKPLGGELTKYISSVSKSELDPAGLERAVRTTRGAMEKYYRNATKTEDNPNGFHVQELYNSRSFPGISNKTGSGVPLETKEGIHRSAMGRGSPHDDMLYHAYTATLSAKNSGTIARGLSNIGGLHNIVTRVLGPLGDNGSQAAAYTQTLFSKGGVADMPAIDMGTVGGQFSWIQGQIHAFEDEQDTLKSKRPLPPASRALNIDAPERNIDTSNRVSSTGKAVDLLGFAFVSGKQGANALNTSFGRKVFSGNSTVSDHLNWARGGARMLEQFRKLESVVGPFENRLVKAAPGMPQAEVEEIVGALALHANADQGLGVFRGDRVIDKTAWANAKATLAPWLKFYKSGSRLAAGVGTSAEAAVYAIQATKLLPSKVGGMSDESPTLGDALFGAGVGNIKETDVPFVNAIAQQGEAWTALQNTPSSTPKTYSNKAEEIGGETEKLQIPNSPMQKKFAETALLRDPTRAATIKLFLNAKTQYRRANDQQHVADDLVGAILDGFEPGVREQRINDPSDTTIAYSPDVRAKAAEAQRNYENWWGTRPFWLELVEGVRGDHASAFPTTFRGKTHYDIWNTAEVEVPGGLKIPFKEQSSFEKFEKRFAGSLTPADGRISRFGARLSVKKRQLKPGIDDVIKARLYNTNPDGTVYRRPGVKYDESVETVTARRDSEIDPVQNIEMPGMGLIPFDMGDPNDGWIFWNTIQAPVGSELATHNAATRAIRAKTDYQSAQDSWDELEVTPSDIQKHATPGSGPVDIGAGVSLAGQISALVDPTEYARTAATLTSTVAYKQKQGLAFFRGKLDSIAAKAKSTEDQKSAEFKLAGDILGWMADNLERQELDLNVTELVKQFPDLQVALSRIRKAREQLALGQAPNP
jgi:hypothetical protein